MAEDWLVKGTVFEIDDVLDIIGNTYEEKKEGLYYDELVTQLKTKAQDFDTKLLDAYLDKLAQKRRVAILVRKEGKYLIAYRALAVDDTDLYQELKAKYLRKVRNMQNTRGRGLDVFSAFRDDETSEQWLNDSACLGVRDRIKREGVMADGRKLVGEG